MPGKVQGKPSIVDDKNKHGVLAAKVQAWLRESAGIKMDIAKGGEVLDGIVAAAAMIVECYEEGGKVAFFGNGGSAADAQHLACELVSKFRLERKALGAIAFTTDTSILTAIPNDYSFENIFVRQLEALMRKGDVVVGISTSGNSPNVLKALAKAKELGIGTIGLSGAGGKLPEVVDVAIKVPSKDTPRIQESHIAIGHIICDLVESEMFG